MPSRALGTGIIAALSLVLGFGIAQWTGLRWAGGAVLVLGALWCVVRQARHSPWWLIVGVLALAGLGFVVAHLLADHLGAWPAVLLVGLVVGLSAWYLLTPRRGR